MKISTRSPVKWNKSICFCSKLDIQILSGKDLAGQLLMYENKSGMNGNQSNTSVGGYNKIKL
jgi:hypothetical protein